MVERILVQCIFARQVWTAFLSSLRLGPELSPSTHDTLVYWWTAARKQITKESRKGFDTFMLLVGAFGSKGMAGCLVELGF